MNRFPRGTGQKRKLVSEASQVWCGREKMVGEPVVFVSMLTIHDTRFWYHDLIGQIINCRQVSNEY